jgi:hypothetical protein
MSRATFSDELPVALSAARGHVCATAMPAVDRFDRRAANRFSWFQFHRRMRPAAAPTATEECGRTVVEGVPAIDSVTAAGPIRVWMRITARSPPSFGVIDLGPADGDRSVARR